MPTTTKAELAEFLTIEEAAQALGWNKATLWKWMESMGIKTKHFPRTKKAFLSAADVEALREARQKPWLINTYSQRNREEGQEQKQPAPNSDVLAQVISDKIIAANITFIPEAKREEFASVVREVVLEQITASVAYTEPAEK